MKNWRHMVLSCLLIAVVLTVAACAPGATPAPVEPAPATEVPGAAPADEATEAPAGEATEAPAAEATEAPAAATGQGGDLIIAVPANSEPASFDGHIDPYQSTWLFNSFVADPLVVQGPDGVYVPALATSWETSEDGNSWIFQLRDDVTFQDGTPFNAEAVKYNLDRIKDPATGSAQLADDLGPITSVEVVDEFTVAVHYDAPWVTILDAIRRTPIWSPTAAEEFGLADFDENLVGAGPFTFEEWVPNDHVTLRKWEDYGGWNTVQQHEGAAYLDSVTIRFIGEEAVLGSVVNTGDAHIAQELPATYVVDYEDNPEAQMAVGYQAGTGLQMTMNTTRAPLDQLQVRQALLHATDQEALNDLLYDGLYLVQRGPLNSVHPCYWEGVETMYPYDLERAGALLEEVGWTDEDGDGIREAHGVPGVEDGTPLTIRWTVLHHEEIGEALQGQFRQIGVDLVVELVPGPVQLDRVQQRDFDLMYERQRTPDPRVLDQIWNSKWDEPGGWAWSGLDIPELNTILDEITTNPDLEERCELAAEAQRIVMENAGMLPTLSQPVYYAISNQVQGFQMGAEGNWFFLNDTFVAE